MNDVEVIEECIAQLCTSWTERIEYGVRIDGGETERRVAPIRQMSLLFQLRRVSLDGEAAGTKCERSAPNKPASRPPGSMRGLELIDRITEEAYYCYDLILAHQGRGMAEPMSIKQILGSIIEALPTLETQPHIVREIRTYAQQWVLSARILLGYDKRKVLLPEAACGECGGVMSVAEDASSSVACVDRSCGKEYPHTQWISLLNKGVGNSW